MYHPCPSSSFKDEINRKNKFYLKYRFSLQILVPTCVNQSLKVLPSLFFYRRVDEPLVSDLSFSFLCRLSTLHRTRTPVPGGFDLTKWSSCLWRTWSGSTTRVSVHLLPFLCSSLLVKTTHNTDPYPRDPSVPPLELIRSLSSSRGTSSLQSLLWPSDLTVIFLKLKIIKKKLRYSVHTHTTPVVPSFHLFLLSLDPSPCFVASCKTSRACKSGVFKSSIYQRRRWNWTRICKEIRKGL